MAQDERLRYCGELFRVAVTEVCEAMTAKPLRLLGLNAEEIAEALNAAKKDLKSTESHAYMDYFTCCGQKPE